MMRRSYFLASCKNVKNMINYQDLSRIPLKTHPQTPIHTYNTPHTHTSNPPINPTSSVTLLLLPWRTRQSKTIYNEKLHRTVNLTIHPSLLLTFVLSHLVSLFHRHTLSHSFMPAHFISARCFPSIPTPTVTFTPHRLAACALWSWRLQSGYPHWGWCRAPGAHCCRACGRLTGPSKKERPAGHQESCRAGRWGH